jgi:polyhydroxyalkanoate synthesis regulator phasin
VTGEGSKTPPQPEERGVAEALRSAIERTLDATAGPGTRERAADLLDEVARRGRDAREEVARRGRGAREEVARRGQEAGAELAKRGQGARDEVARRLEALEGRLASLEEALRRESDDAADEDQSEPEAEG